VISFALAYLVATGSLWSWDKIAKRKRMSPAWDKLRRRLNWNHIYRPKVGRAIARTFYISVFAIYLIAIIELCKWYDATEAVHLVEKEYREAITSQKLAEIDVSLDEMNVAIDERIEGSSRANELPRLRALLKKVENHRAYMSIADLVIPAPPKPTEL
jgi:hypothetical protein